MLQHRLSPELQARLDAELAIGEKVVWTGQPRAITPASFAAAAVPLALASTTLIAIGIGLGVSRSGPAVPFGAFLGLGALVVVLVAIASRAATRGTIYAITDRRAIVIEPARPGMGVTTRSYAPAALAAITRCERANGLGDLVFDTRWGGKAGAIGVGFIRIADARRVETILRATLLA